MLPARAVAPRSRRGGVPSGGARAVRLARRAGRRVRARVDGARVHAPDRAARARAVRRGGRRAARVPGSPARRARGRRLHRVALVPNGHLQGALRGDPARRLLPRSPGRALGRVVRDLPPALLDEHRAELGARPAVPPALPQRRDQHDRGQRRVDGGARACARPRPEPFAGARSPRLRLRAPRQRRRAARPLRPRHRRGADATRPARVAERPPDRRGGARDAPLPRDGGRALGRPRRARLHGRHRLRGEARPERPAPAPRGDLRRRARRRLLGSGRGPAPRGRRRPPGAPGAGPAPLRRPPARAPARRRADARARGAQAVRGLGLGEHRLRRCRRVARRTRGRSRRAARAPRLHARGAEPDAPPDRAERPRPGVLDGGRRADRPARRARASAGVVLPAALRPGDEPGDRPLPRANRDVGRDARRPASGDRRRGAARAARRAPVVPGHAAGARRARAGMGRRDLRRGRGPGTGGRARRRRVRGARGGGRHGSLPDRRRGRRRPRVDPLPSRGVGRARPPRRARAPARRVAPRVERRHARQPHGGDARGLWSRRRLPAARARDRRPPRFDRQGRRRPPLAGGGAAAAARRVRGRRPQGHVEDGHLGRRQLPGRPPVRGRRARSAAVPALLRRDALGDRRDRARPARARGARPPRGRLRRQARAREPRLLQVPQGRRAARDRPRRRRRRCRRASPPRTRSSRP